MHAAFGSSQEEDHGLVGRKGAAGDVWANALGDGCGGARSTKGLGTGTDGVGLMSLGEAQLMCSGGTRPATNKTSPVPAPLHRLVSPR